MEAHPHFFNRIRKLAIILFALTASSILAIGSLHPNSATASLTYSVTIIDYAFEPLHINITTGTTVTWTYASSGKTAHTVTSNPQTNITQSGTPLINSGDMNPGQSFSYIFNLPGYYPYQCSLHPTISAMNGWVMVTGNPVTQSPGSSNSSVLPILVATIAVGAIAVILVTLSFRRRKRSSKPAGSLQRA